MTANLNIGFRTPRDEAKRFFFDRAEVEGRMDEVTRRFLGFFGGDTQREARRIVRSGRDGAPRSHTGILRKSILFFATDQQNVIIGPTVPPVGDSPNFTDQSTTGQTIPQLLEEGGTQQIRAWFKDEETGRLRHPEKLKRRRARAHFVHSPDAPLITARYPARPYMQPAFEKALQTDRETRWRRAAEYFRKPPSRRRRRA